MRKEARIWGKDSIFNTIGKTELEKRYEIITMFLKDSDKTSKEITWNFLSKDQEANWDTELEKFVKNLWVTYD